MTTTTRMAKLSFTLLTSSLLVLSSIAAAQLFVSNSNAAFAEVNCDEPIETDGTIEQTCSGGNAFSRVDAEGRGGFGGHSTCTADLSAETETCTGGGGSGISFGPFGSGNDAGGGGGRSTCTFDNPTGEQSCSFEAGGGGSKPLPDEEGG
ncbi:MAG TPA: hypothetical protein VKA40_10465 [Nitrososphaera sp.]|nr:hypothetical protein [Nitrososphaera sp.]